MEQGMSRPQQALIIGGGIAGPVTAIFLKKAGIDAELFEAWPLIPPASAAACRSRRTACMCWPRSAWPTT
jgi:2-polyprenyl-6-methoxyphenol hydroxylase-like FAD-dependent oxidoreductase